MADRTSSSITIGAGAAEIMAVIADLESYPEWTSGIRFEVLETGADGRASRARMTIAVGPINDTVELAYTWSGDERASWETVAKGSMIAGLHGTYTLVPAGAATEVTYELAVDLMVPMIGMVKRKAEKRIIDGALKGLKRHVEG